MEPLPEIMNQLSPKQRKIANFLAVGVTSTKIIGQLLETKPHTIKVHISNMADKFGLSGRTQLAVYVLTGYKPATADAKQED